MRVQSEQRASTLERNVGEEERQETQLTVILEQRLRRLSVGHSLGKQYHTHDLANLARLSQVRDELVQRIIVVN